MDEFLRRIGESTVKVLKYLVPAILSLVLLGGIALVLFYLPVWLLSYWIGSLAFYWIFFIAGVIMIYAEWEKIKGWIYWQFIEPFKK